MTEDIADITITVSQCRRAVVTAILANIPVAIWGESGVGKSTVVSEIADKLAYDLYDFRMSDKDPTDVGGTPVPVRGAATHTTKGESLTVEDFMQTGSDDEGRLVYYVTPRLPWKKFVGKKKCILFLDEFDRSEPALQNMALQLVHDRSVNGNDLGENVVIVLAGNGNSDVYTTPLSQAAARRMIHLYVSRSGDKGLRSYEEWAEKEKISPHHYGFARFCNEAWNTGQEEAEFIELGKPCPRTWDMAGKVYDVLKDIEDREQFKTEDLYMPLLAGCVGKMGAGVYRGWRNMCEQAPNPKEVLKAPKTAAIPDVSQEGQLGILYGLVASLSDCCDDYNTAEKVSIYLVRVGDQAKQEEIAAMGFRRMITKLPEAATVEIYLKWAEKHKELLRG